VCINDLANGRDHLSGHLELERDSRLQRPGIRCQEVQPAL
jgi:hypothetical protein